MSDLADFNNCVGAYRRVWEFTYLTDVPVFAPNPQLTGEMDRVGTDRNVKKKYHVIAADEKLAKAAWDQFAYKGRDVKLIDGPTNILVVDDVIQCLGQRFE